jgi:hypothetical protein
VRQLAAQLAARLARSLLLAGLAACGAPPPPPAAPATTRCHAGVPAGAVAARVGAELEAAGWGAVVVERHGGRHLVRARRGDVVLAGKVEEGIAACAGAQVTVRELVVPARAASLEAGPRGPRQTRP